jgi:Ni/Co efflux regulator RcnB
MKMKYLVTTALALSLIAGGSAFAQDRDHDGRGGDHQHGQAPAAPPAPHNHAGPAVNQGAAPQARPEGRPGPAPGQNFDRGRQGQGPGNFDRGRQGQGPGNFDRGRQGQGPGNFDRGRQGPGPGNFDRGRQDQGPGNFDRGRPGPGNGGFDRGRPGPGAFNGRPGSFLSGRNWHATQRFRGPSYRYPRGYGYQRWAFGAFLPSIFLEPDYTLSDYWTYGLPAPPPGFHWIRVGPDALLVRYGDGYVLDAAYGLFY